MRNRGTYLLRVRHQSQYGLEKTLGSEWRQYEEAFPKLQTSRSILSRWSATTRAYQWICWSLSVVKVMVGAIDVATQTIETPEEVADTLRKALQFVDADKLYPSTNCGMAPLSRRSPTVS